MGSQDFTNFLIPDPGIKNSIPGLQSLLHTRVFCTSRADCNYHEQLTECFCNCYGMKTRNLS